MISLRKAGIAGAIATAVALIGTTLPAQAATAPAWHQVFSKHYGPAKNDYSGITSVVSFGTKNVWALGGSDLSGGNGTTPQVVATQWNGSYWTGNQAPAGVKSYVSAVGASSASNIWAVTFYGGYVLRYDGHHWTVAKHLPGNGLLNGVTVLAANNVWVFGTSGYGPGDGTWHYNGSTWTHVTGTYDAIGGASAVNANDIWGSAAVNGPSDTLVRFDGHSWKPVAGVPTGLTNIGATAFAANDVWISGQKAGSSTSYYVQYTGHWSAEFKVPWGLQAGGLVPDGKGGVWFTSNAPGNAQRYEVHWIPGTDKWFRDPVPFGSFSGASSLAFIPGTTSVVAGGLTEQATGGSAVVWAYGTI
jgi:hypothetical protein